MGSFGIDWYIILTFRANGETKQACVVMIRTYQQFSGFCFAMFFSTPGFDASRVRGTAVRRVTKNLQDAFRKSEFEDE